MWIGGIGRYAGMDKIEQNFYLICFFSFSFVYWVIGGFDGDMDMRHNLHSIWKGMMSRCYDRSNSAFKYYGGRGIFVCSDWHSFETFAHDMSPRPTEEHSLGSAIDYTTQTCLRSRARVSSGGSHSTLREGVPRLCDLVQACYNGSLSSLL